MLDQVDCLTISVAEVGWYQIHDLLKHEDLIQVAHCGAIRKNICSVALWGQRFFSQGHACTDVRKI